MTRPTALGKTLAAVAAVAVTAALAASGSAGASPGGTRASGAVPGVTQAWVTLVTGDRVLVRTTRGHTTATVDAAPRAGLAQFATFAVHGDQYVMPADAVALVQAGALDRRLFDVSELVRDGYDDAHSGSIPLLVQYAGGAHRSALPAAPAGASVRRSLPGLGMAALDERKQAAPGFWSRSLTRTTATGTGPEATVATRLAPGYARVWLDGRVHPNLDQSVPQIGAPAAWAKGFTGKGVTVAVLDTGIDTTHPDFAGRIGQTRDFTGSGSIRDGFGHGTHVASIVAGSGAASGGKYRGVAPDATLEIGRVFDDDGTGSDDEIIAAMQWAAQSGARIVNMSLGSEQPSDGTDPMAQALNQLSAQYGTLFVVSAGNFGSDQSVASPAAADASLAVASVTKQDALSDFSSRGPRLGDGAAKPDISAPGSDIVAAWAAGTPPLSGQPVGDHYQRLSGTSMAAPHVAGSAALLLQQHPDWSGPRLEEALMSTSKGLDGIDPYGIGAGRVDVAHATSQDVTATGSVSAFLPWPNAGASKAQTVTWHNDGTAPVTLSLTPTVTGQDGQPAPAALFTLSAGTVTVPAGGAASVDVTVTAQDGHPGHYAGILAAASADGSVSTRTTLSAYQEEEKYDLTVDLLDRNGAASQDLAESHAFVTNLDTLDLYVVGNRATLRLPGGRYVVDGSIATPRAGKDPSYSLVTDPEVVLGRDTTVTLDARDAQPMSVTTDNPALRGGTQAVAMLTRSDACDCDTGLVSEVDPRFSPLYAATAPGTNVADFASVQTREAMEPTVEMSGQDGDGTFAVHTVWFDAEPVTDEKSTVTAVWGGAGTPEDLAKIDAHGKLVIFAEPFRTSYDDIYAAIQAIKDAGGSMAMLVPAEEADGTQAAAIPLSGGSTPSPGLPTVVSQGPTMARLVALAKATGGTTLAYVHRPYPAHRYELAYLVTGKLDAAQIHRPRTQDLVAVRTTYHDASVPSMRAHGVESTVELSGHTGGAGDFLPAGPAVQRTEYYTPGTWSTSEQSGAGDVASETRDLRAGHRYSLDWNKAVSGPSLTGMLGSGGKGRPWVWRTGGTVDALLPVFSDSAGHPLLPQGDFDGSSGSISLYRDGQLVDTSPAPDSGVFTVPDEASDYRLVAHAERHVDWWPLSTTVDAAWTFRSSSDDEGSALPLLTVRFDPALDVHNNAPGRQSFTFPAYVARQGADSVHVASLTVDVSYDDGKTWTPATVTASGDHWNVAVTHPASGYATLRTTATDTDGNAVTETMVRAYQFGRTR